MIRLLGVAFAALFSFLSVANAAGIVPGFSLTPQFDNTGKVAPGCRLYVIQAGTVSTPQNAYQDTALSLLQPNPMLCDATGRLPQWFVADGTIKLRLTDKNGVEIFAQDNLLVVGPSTGGGGGGGTVDPTTIFTTGDVKYVYGSQPITGWVRLNGRTIGSATSGATERANADCQALFVYLWGDPNSVVPGGKGASASADWAANKVITLPDARGRVIAGLDDMGNSAAGRLTATYFGTAATALGAAGGGQSQTLVLLNLPPYTPAGSLSLSTPVSTSVTTTVTGTALVTTTVSNVVTANSIVSSGAGGGANAQLALPASIGPIVSSGSITASASSSATSTATPTGTFTGTAQGGTSSPFRTLQPTILMTFYVKL